MSQYFLAYTKDVDKETVWSLQDEMFARTKDYGFYNGLKLREHSRYGNSVSDFFGHFLYKHPVHLAWVADDATESEYYGKCWGVSVTETDHKVTPAFSYHGKYFVNHDKKCAFAFENVEPYELWPVPFVTAVGYSDAYPVGNWAGDFVSIEDSIPGTYKQLPSELFIWEDL